LTGDLFGSRRCDCGAQLESAMKQIAAEGCGVILYLRQEGRGIGLANKLKAYCLQSDLGLDTHDANLHLGFPADLRDFVVAAKILQQLQVVNIQLLSNNPEKIACLRSEGIHVSSRVPLIADFDSFSSDYIRAKRDRFGHYL
jgi:GTP cyclohydrolase II